MRVHSCLLEYGEVTAVVAAAGNSQGRGSASAVASPGLLLQLDANAGASDLFTKPASEMSAFERKLAQVIICTDEYLKLYIFFLI